jgi:hypothetical protein
MSQKQINPGLLSSMRGAELFAFAFRIDGTNDPDILVQLGANAVESVVRDSAGTFIVRARSWSSPRWRRRLRPLRWRMCDTCSTRTTRRLGS